MKSIIAVTAADMSVDIYGIYRDNSTRISNANIAQLTHASSPYPTSLQRVDETVTPYYRSFYSYYGEHHYYEIEGTFILRASNLSGSSMSIFITEPSMQQWGTRRLLIKKNSTAVTGWTEMTMETSCSSQCRWYLPNNYLTTLTFEVGQQYVWKYTTEFYDNSDGAR